MVEGEERKEESTIPMHATGLKNPTVYGWVAGSKQPADTFPSQGSLSEQVGQVFWLAACAYSLRLPKPLTSVACADFVPLTVTG